MIDLQYKHNIQYDTFDLIQFPKMRNGIDGAKKKPNVSPINLKIIITLLSLLSPKKGCGQKIKNPIYDARKKTDKTIVNVSLY